MPRPRAPAKPARPAKARTDSRIARLSHNLEALLRADIKGQKVPAGMAQCPECGTAIEPTRTGAVRTHFDPLTGERCSASKRKWSAFGKRAPKPLPPTAKAPKAKKAAKKAATKRPKKTVRKKGRKT